MSEFCSFLVLFDAFLFKLLNLCAQKVRPGVKLDLFLSGITFVRNGHLFMNSFFVRKLVKFKDASAKFKNNPK